MEDYQVLNKNYNHLDFTCGRKSGFYVNGKVLELLQRCDRDVCDFISI